MTWGTAFVCEACARLADKKERGEKAHVAAGCPGKKRCDCQHREYR